MSLIRLESETDFDGWRKAARALRAAEVSPDRVVWKVGDGADLFAEELPVPPVDAPVFAVPRAFLELAQDVVLHRDPDRFELLYRLLWRVGEEPNLLKIVTDYEVGKALAMRKAVGKAAYQMKQYVRFRKVEDGDEPAYVAWIEPQHRVVAKAAPFFVERFANMRWSILTPDACAHWDGEGLSYTPGLRREHAPEPDVLEDLWRSYFSSTFNPARLKVKAMTSQMPKRLWRNLPEAAVIPRLIEQAAARAETMVQSPHTEPQRRLPRRERAAETPVSVPGDSVVPASVEEVWPAVQACRRCDLWRNATQGVAGKGPATARLMFVGEQPGDQEDLAGEPFVGPAGQLFDRALAEAGVPRAETYVTNAVKHFKFEPRGKRRLHRKPDGGEIKACRWWLEHERKLVKPRLIVALGATAGQSVLGRPVSVMKERGAPVPLEDGSTAFLTVHPSYMLRLPEQADRDRAYGMFVEDLRAAWSLAA